MSEKIKKRAIEKEMEESYLDYAMSVIVSRALPDVRDGLKPVQRRILYTMYKLGMFSDRPFKKSARVVGDCLAKFHPHGDVAVYDSLARLTQDFTMRYPLVDGQGNWGCFTKDTKIRLCDGRSLSFEELIKEQKEGKRHWTFTFNLQTGKIEITEIKRPRLTRKKQKIIEITLDNGKRIKSTLDHLFLLKDGSYKKAKDLKNGDSLMPLYTKVYSGEKDINLKGYEMVYQPLVNDWEFIHHLADDWNLKNGIYKRSSGKIRHHKDFNKLNNNPENIIRIQWQDHWQYHKEITLWRHKNDQEYVKKLKEGREKFIKENPHLLSIRVINLNKKLWSNPEFRKNHSERIKKLWRDPKYRECRAKISSENLKKLWRREEFRKKISKLKSEELKKRWQDENYRKIMSELMRKISLKIWSDPKHREYISSLMKEKAKNPEWRERQSKIARELWKDPQYRAKYPEDHFSKMAKKLWEIRNAKKVIKEECYQVTSQKYNHRVTATKILKKKEDVYDLTVEPWHNFSLEAGIFVHNSIDGDPPAAQRYTECRLAKISEEILADIEKDTVNFTPNYDGTEKEPTVLPSKIPNLIINGSQGIAVGMATSIPPHNLKEVCQALIFLIDHPQATVEDLLKFIKGPDFPTAGYIFDQEAIKSAYSTGKGAILMRGKAEIVSKDSHHPEQIVISEIPYQVNKSLLLERIAQLIKEKKVEGIRDLRDESDKEGIRIVIELKKGVEAKKILNFLFKHTQLEETFYLNFLSLIDGIQPKVLNLKGLLEEYLKHRKEVIRRRSEFDLKKAQERLHILKGLKIALENIDLVIKIIKKSKDREEAKKELIKILRLDEKQSEAILEIRLHQLAHLERRKIEDELKEKTKLIKELEEILRMPKKILEIIKNELKDIEEKYGDERRTVVVPTKPEEFTFKDLVPDEPCLVTITKDGYLKRISPTAFKIQERGGKGVKGLERKEEDIVEHFLSTSTHSSLLFFSDKGKVFQLKGYEVPEATRLSRGEALVNFLSLSKEEKISSLLSFREIKDYKYLLLITEKGLIKKIETKDLEKIRKSGLLVMKLRKEDCLKSAKFSAGKDEILIVTAFGQLIRFKEEQVRKMTRSATGVKAISLGKNDQVVGMEVIDSKLKNQNLRVLTVTENGFGKLTCLKYYRLQKRGGKGIKTGKVTKKVGKIVKTLIIGEKDLEKDLLIISQSGQVLRINIKSIPTLSRVTQGVRLMRFKEKDDKVASITLI